MNHIEPTTGEQCLLCLVRQMTEGTPETARFNQPGDTVTGVILRKGTVAHPFNLPPPDDTVPFLDLWTGTVRVRVVAMAQNLHRQVTDAEIQIGDTVTVTFLGNEEIPNGKYAGRQYARFQLDVKRGHH